MEIIGVVGVLILIAINAMLDRRRERKFREIFYPPEDD